MNSLATRALAAAFAWVSIATPAHAAGSLNLTPDIPVTVVLLLAFILLIFPLNQLIFAPLIKVMEERDERIAGAKARAESVQVQAQEAIDRYEEAIRVAYDESGAERRRRLDVARGELAEITQKARTEAEREVGRAREELQGSLDEARSTLRGNAEELAGLAAERILGRSLS